MSIKPDYKELWQQLSREFVLLEEENEKLRAALKPFSQYTFEKYDGSDPAIIELVADLKAAAAALKEME